MKDLEVQTYNFAVDGIGLIKSLEKEYPELVSQDLKQNIGAVSLKYLDAVEAKENEDFAKNLRECHSSAKKSVDLLNTLNLENETLNEQKNKLLKDSEIIIEKLDKIISKLIY